MEDRTRAWTRFVVADILVSIFFDARLGSFASYLTSRSNKT
jgi:hypothetical protein